MSKWGFWGWVETVAKFVGMAGGLVAGVLSVSAGPLGWGSAIQATTDGVFAVLVLFAGFQFVLRIKQRDAFTLVFASLNLAAHLMVFFALLHPEFSKFWPSVFAGFYLIGQLAKIRFLRVTGYTEAGATPVGIFVFTAVQTLGYLAFAWLVTL